MNIANIMRRYKLTYSIGKGFRYIETKIKNMAFETGAFFRSKGIGIKKYKRLYSLKGTYAGERCFIIATGPSLTEDDILSLRNEYTFSMNSICYKYDDLDWTPTFYGVQDSKVFHTIKKHISNKNIQYCFVDAAYRNESDNDPEWIYFPRNSYYNAYDAYFHHKYYAKFSGNAVAEIYEGFTVTCSLIQIAYFMGFTEIYLLGCDCNYTSDHSKNHFVDHGVIDPTYKESKKRMIAGYEAAKRFADRHNLKIYNATRGGMLEVFERRSLDDLDLK